MTAPYPIAKWASLAPQLLERAAHRGRVYVYTAGTMKPPSQ
jgi:hypothetical protein